MHLKVRSALAALATAVLAGAYFLSGVGIRAQSPGAASGPQGSSGQPSSTCEPGRLGSPFLPVDSWIYAAVWRLHSLGYVDDAFLGMRPWTRASVGRMMEETEARLDTSDSSDGVVAAEARKIYDAITYELLPDMEGPCRAARGEGRIESVYSVSRMMSGTPLRDSFHLGSTVINDYGRPYENGYNNFSGISGYATAGRFTLYARGEFQGAPSASGYPMALAQTLSTIVDGITPFINPVTNLPYPQATIPMGPVGTATQGRFLEAYVSGQVLNHVILLGKTDEWMGPAEGGSFAYSNNAENLYALHINRIEPLHVPGLSRFTGPFRYEFLVGALRGHTLVPNPAYQAHPSPNIHNVITPGNPWVHIEKISFKPTPNVEFGFERTALFGGEGHSPVTLHTFLKSFFSVTAGGGSEKAGRGDPGARFGSFDVSYRLPFVRNWLTFYADGEVHDDISPIDAPRRAAWRPGLYLAHVPGVPKLDVRFEAAMTDPSVTSSSGGKFMYWENIEKQGYTNQGQIFGDWIGREDKGGQAWITYHLSGNEWVQLTARNQKAAKDFIPGGTTLDDVGFQVVKRLGRDLELNGSFAYEHWNAPIYLTGRQTVTTTNMQITWYPQRKTNF
jgi:hypothetical protein